MTGRIGVNAAGDTLRAAWTPRDVLRFSGLGALYAALWIVTGWLSSEFWFLPAGLRFLVLWLLPTSRWPVAPDETSSLEGTAIVGFRVPDSVARKSEAMARDLEALWAKRT